MRDTEGTGREARCVYVLTDLEGVAGIDQWDPHRYDDAASRRWKAEAVELLTGEVQAAVDGALEAGVREIRIRDGHGHADDLPAKGWPTGVELIQGAAASWLPGLDATVDALLFVGQHAMEGAPESVLAHSWSARRPRRCHLDGREVGELGAATLLAASMGVSTAFVSGDRAAVLEARALVPQVGSAEVKWRTGHGSITHLSPADARDRIRLGVLEALCHVPEPPPMDGGGCHTFQESFLRPPLAGWPFLAARLGGHLATRALLKRVGRWPGDPTVTARVLDRRTLEYEGPSVAAVLRPALGGG